jgi:hypothetical protein
MDFIEDDETIFELPQEERWLCKPVAILARLQVKVERPWAMVCKLSRQRGFSDLTRPDDRNSGLFRKRLLDS